MGCGTGLMGAEIKDYCSNLEGIDLSKKMLELANAKNVYDKLIHTDILDFLANTELCFDYFIATDVLSMLEILTELFRLIKSRNKQKGKVGIFYRKKHNRGLSVSKHLGVIPIRKAILMVYAKNSTTRYHTTLRQT